MDSGLRNGPRLPNAGCCYMLCLIRSLAEIRCDDLARAEEATDGKKKSASSHSCCRVYPGWGSIYFLFQTELCNHSRVFRCSRTHWASVKALEHPSGSRVPFLPLSCAASWLLSPSSFVWGCPCVGVLSCPCCSALSPLAASPSLCLWSCVCLDALLTF